MAEIACFMRSKVIDQENISWEIKNYLKNMINLLSAQEADKKVAFLVGNSPRTSSSTILTLMSYDTKNRTENIIKQIIVKTAFDLEKNHAISANIMIKYIKYFYEMMERLERSDLSQKEIDNHANKSLKSHLENVQNSLQRPNISHLKRFLKNNFNPKINSLLTEILNLAGPTGKISFHEENTEKIILESKSSYQFLLDPEPNLMIENNFEWKRQDVATLVIEGFIEKVSEIDCVLSKVVEKNIPLLIVCLGYSQEVISTIALNNRRGTFDVMIATPCKEDDAVNDLSDMTCIFGTPYHGYQTGTISTAFTEEDLDLTCEEIIVSPEKIHIKNSKTRKSVLKRLERLKSQIGNHELSVNQATGTNTSLMDDYLRRRIDCLTSHQVKISLPKINAQKKFGLIEQIDYGLRASKSIIKNGTINFKSKEKVVKDGEYIASSIYLGIKFGYELSKQFMSMKKAIIFDD